MSSAKSIGIYEAEKIIKKRTRNNRTEYYVKWANYPVSQSTWEPAKNILDHTMIEAFEEDHKSSKTTKAKAKPKSPAKASTSSLPKAKKSLPNLTSKSTVLNGVSSNESLIVSSSRPGSRSPRTSTPTRGEKRVRLNLNASPVRNSSRKNDLVVPSFSVNIDQNANQVEMMITYNGEQYRFVNTFNSSAIVH